MANLTQWIAAGFERMYYGGVVSNYLTGSTLTAPAAGTTTGSGMGKLDGVQTADVTIPEPEDVPVSGDDDTLGKFTFPSTETPSFTIETGTANLGFDALVQGTTTYADGSFTYGVLQPNAPDFPDICLLLSRRAKSRVTGSIGTAVWEHLLIPKANIIPLGSSGFTGRSAASFRYRVVANKADTFPTGMAVSDANFATTGGSLFPFTSDNRVTMHRATGNGTATAFTVDYTPASSVITTVNRIWVNGTVATTGVTVTTGTKSYAWGTAPANNAVIVIMYEHT